MNCHLIPELGSHRLSTLRTVEVQQAVKRIARITTPTGILAPATIKGIVAVLRSAMGAARRAGFIDYNPAWRIRMPEPIHQRAVTWTGQRKRLWRPTGVRPTVAV